MINKKTYILLFIVLVVFLGVMFLAFGVNNIKKNTYDTTIIVGDSTIWTYNKKNWLNLRNKSSIAELNWKEFNIYLNNEKFGKYSLWYDDKWYAFDKNRNAVKMEGDMLAYRANFDLNVLQFSEEEITDRTYVDYVLEENNLSVDSQFSSSYKVSLDFDNDDNVEEFYLLTNVFPLDFIPDVLFSIVFMVKDGKVYYLYNGIRENRSLSNGCKPFFNTFLDADNDKTAELILSCAGYSVSGQTDMLYKFDKLEDAFKIVISNQ